MATPRLLPVPGGPTVSSAPSPVKTISPPVLSERPRNSGGLLPAVAGGGVRFAGCEAVRGLRRLIENKFTVFFQMMRPEHVDQGRDAPEPEQDGHKVGPRPAPVARRVKARRDDEQRDKARQRGLRVAPPRFISHQTQI